MKLKISAVLLLSAAILSACGSPSSSPKLDRASGAVNMGLERMGDRNNVRAGGSQFSNGIFVGASPERNNSSALLPAHLQSASAVVLKSRDPMSLAEVAQQLTAATNIQHVLALGPTGQISGNAEQLPSAADSSSTIATGREMPEEPRARRASNPQDGTISQQRITPDLRGSLSDVLNTVTSNFDVEWSYSEGRIIFRDYVTRKYQITALPVATTATTAIGNNGITSGSSMSSDVWAEVRETLDSLLGEGSGMSIGSTTGLVTVTAKISDQNRVKEYITELNASVGQQISFDVYVMTVNLKEEQNYGVDLAAALARGTNGAARFGGSPFGASGEIGSYNIGLISGDVSLAAVVNALSSQGKVAVTTRAGTTTSNNRVAPIEVVDEFAYLAEVTIEEDDDGNDRIVRSPDTVTTGFQMQLFPRIMNNRDIMVQYTVRLSELNDIQTFGEGNEAVQLPEVSTTTFEQQAVLENGQTLVIAGFERERVTKEDRKGANLLTGFSKSGGAATDRVATVMMITPRLISR